MTTPTQPTSKLHDDLVTDIICKLKTISPYLERSSDLELQSKFSKFHKEVDDLYNYWLRAKDLEGQEPPYEEDWDENAESVGGDSPSDQDTEGEDIRSNHAYSKQCSPRSAMTVDGGQVKGDLRKEPEHGIDQLQDTMQRYLPAVNPPQPEYSYSPSPAKTPSPPPHPQLGYIGSAPSNKPVAPQPQYASTSTGPAATYNPHPPP